MMGGGQQQLQQLSQEIQAIDGEIEALEAQIADDRAEQSAIDDAIEAIETLDTGSTVQVPLGGDAYVRAEVADIDEILVGLGGNYAAEQGEEDAIDVLRHKRDAIDDRIEETRAKVDDLESESEQIEREAQQMQQQMQQQQMQQLQEQDGGE